MKLSLTITLLFAFISSGAIAAIGCESQIGCQKKICQLEKQIEIAKSMNNKYKISGLQTALSKIRDHCSDDSIREKLQHDINKSQAELEEYKQDLQEATAEEKTDKIKKYQAKITEEEATLHALQKELDTLK